MLNEIKYQNESREIPTTATITEENDYNNIYYNCPECPSLIEILSIDEENNNIEYNCLSKKYLHGKNKISISEYLHKMNKFNNISINKDTCDIHSANNINNEYIGYCFDCNCHLCSECLQTRNHINHIKNNIIEIKPKREELKVIEEIIKEYNKNLNKLRKEKYSNERLYEEEFNIKKKKEDEIIEKIKENNKDKEKDELKKNKEKYLFDLDEIKKKYNEEIKQRKNKYINDNIYIRNKYKYINYKDNMRYKLNIKNINNSFRQEVKKLNYDTKIEKIYSMKTLIELVYNTYCSYNNNYFNAVNINKILLHYYNNEYINDTIIKQTLKENYEGSLKKISLKRNEEINCYKKQKENDLDEKIIIYKINKNDKKIKIFGTDFVRNNKNKVKIIYEDVEYDLMEDFNLDNSLKQKDMLVIKLKGISYITDMSYMFNNCNSLLDLPDISTWNTSNIKDMSYMFYDCSILKKLPDISDLNTTNVL